MDDLGLTDHVGDYCRFVVATADDDAVRQTLQLDTRPETHGPAADAARSDGDDGVWLWVLPPHAKSANDAALVCGAAALEAGGGLRRVVQVERKTWSPCLELDMREQMLMCETHSATGCRAAMPFRRD